MRHGSPLTPSGISSSPVRVAINPGGTRPSGHGGTNTGSALRFNLGTLAPGQTGTRTYTVTLGVGPGSDGQLETGRATLTADGLPMQTSNQAGAPVRLCDDADPCTTNVCTEDDCTFVAIPNCGGCQNDDDCDDGNDCTDDVCNAGTCENDNDDTNTCAGDDLCQTWQCVAGTCEGAEQLRVDHRAIQHGSAFLWFFTAWFTAGTGRSRARPGMA